MPEGFEPFRKTMGRDQPRWNRANEGCDPRTDHTSWKTFCNKNLLPAESLTFCYFDWVCWVVLHLVVREGLDIRIVTDKNLKRPHKTATESKNRFSSHELYSVCWIFNQTWSVTYSRAIPKLIREAKSGRSDQTSANFLRILKNHNICPSIMQFPKIPNWKQPRDRSVFRSVEPCFRRTEILNRCAQFKKLMVKQNFLIINI